MKRPRSIGEEIKALYEYGVREQPVDRNGQPYTPGFYPNRSDTSKAWDDNAPTSSESVILDVMIRLEIIGLAKTAIDIAKEFE